MALDWSKIGASGHEPLLRPRDIYAALPHRPWPYLRQEQGEVLEKWYLRKDDRDIVIKQNTGGGKTVAGLLIAQSTLNEGVGRAAYLAPDTYLAGRVRQEANLLGLPVVGDPDDPDFHGRQAILVTTFQTLVNGKSRFGVTGDGREPLDLGVVVVDDAHAALATTEGQFRLKVPPGHVAHSALLDLFADDLKQQSIKAWEDIQYGDYTAAQRIPPWAWATKISQVMAIMYPYRLEDAFKFEWPLIADVLHLCAATVTGRGIEIRPPVPPISKIPSFTNARRRVYLTATLADDSILVTDLDADPAQLSRAVTPGSAADLGDRMVLAPIALNPSLDPEAIRMLAKQFSVGDRNGDGFVDSRPVNVVVLVPSTKVAKAWERFADRTLYVKSLEAGVAELRAGHVGVVVLVNKYDGVDLPKTACELLIIDGIPEPMDGVEQREAAALANSPARRIREVQRIEQGMGRGVRDSDDHCAVLLVGSKLAMATRDPDWKKLFSPATRAQLDLSNQVANQLKGQGLDAVRSALTACLDRDPQWVERSRRALAEIRYVDTGMIRTEAVAIRAAFDLASAGQFGAAADEIQRAINGVEDPLLRGLLREQKASYLHHVDPQLAQQQQGVAVQENGALLKPLVGVTTVRVQAVAAQAQAASAFLTSEYGTDGVQLVLGVNATLADIEWDEERTSQAEAAWERLGLHLGFMSVRPEKLYGKGPDNLWALAGDRHAVIEMKTGCTTATIAKKDVDQLGGSVRWDQDNHPGITSIPIMVHPSRVVDRQGTPVPGMRVITATKLDELKSAVRIYAVALADGQGRWYDEQGVSVQLTQARLTAGKFLNAFTEVNLIES
jgi:hypothetical protein